MTPTELAVLLAQPQYPAMTRLESEITRAWLRWFGIAYDRIEFNVRLGGGWNSARDSASRRARRRCSRPRSAPT